MSNLFTAEELEELRRADEEIEKSYRQTSDDIRQSRQRDKQMKLDRLDNKGRKIAEYQAAYREANKDKIAERKAAYYEAHREKYNAYMREYQKRRRAAKKAPLTGGEVR